MSPLRSSGRRAVPRRTYRKLNALATTQRVGVPRLDLAGVWKAQQAKFIAAAFLLVILGGLFEFFNGDGFYVYNFDVTGMRFLTKAELESASGLIGYNVFFVDSRAVERSLSKLPEVKTVRVTTGLPNLVQMQIEERAPEITWLRGAEAYWLDHEGMVFRARSNLTQLPSIRDLDQVAIKPGQSIQSNAFAAYNALHSAWPAAPRAFEWSSTRGLAYVDERGWKIFLGDSGEMAGKLAKLGALVQQLVSQNAHITFIDLSKGEPFYQ